MRIRELKDNDASEMHQWMTNPDITRDLHGNYNNSSIDDALEFIRFANAQNDEIHYAIVNDENEYQGTVSLRHIDHEGSLAEFAIVVLEKAMSRGYAWYAMVQMLKKAFDELGLEKVYWRVKGDNLRALRFFEKHGFNRLDEDVPGEIKDRHKNEKGLVWFAVLKGDDFENTLLNRGYIADCKVIRIKTVPTIEAGELSFFETMRDISFEIKRVYYISKVPEGVRRGFHAHKSLKQVLFCPYGKIQMILDNGEKREELTLSDPSIGILIDKPIWREMIWLEKNSVLVVGASDYYDPSDYIRNYEDYLSYRNESEEV